MEELQAAMTKLIKLQIKQQERHEKWDEKQELPLDRQQPAEELQFEHQKQLQCCVSSLLLLLEENTNSELMLFYFGMGKLDFYIKLQAFEFC